MLSNLNLFFLQELVRRINRLAIPGDIVECGVYKGGSAGVLGYEAIRSPIKRRLWLFDAFAGMPAASAADDDYSRSLQGEYIGSEAQTRRILYRLGIPEDMFRITIGWLEDTLPKPEDFQIALLHVDCDFYSPVKTTLETFYRRVAPGGFVVLNDYGCFPGCKAATDEFLEKLTPKVFLAQIDQDAYCFQKPRSLTTNLL